MPNILIFHDLILTPKFVEKWDNGWTKLRFEINAHFHSRLTFSSWQEKKNDFPVTFLVALQGKGREYEIGSRVLCMRDFCVDFGETNTYCRLLMNLKYAASSTMMLGWTASRIHGCHTRMMYQYERPMMR
jgi:hypothetical protein